MAAPVYVKGGVWSNLEDQILKAGVSKYGPHQWSKIASLLQKKTSRQCEIRWTEYLQPSLNFTKFSKQEDIKLLNLARRLPNQWRSIGSMLNRPAQTCIERYNKLMLNDGEDVKVELHTGDINPNAETQVALPDKNELDDDEKEMLAEAKVRLISTQGKKATRKIRERMLDESKRIALLQKRREMKQAGISQGIKRGKRKYNSEIDYNVEIPYEQSPLPGIYDTSKEDERMMRELSKFENMVMRKGLQEKEDRPEKKQKKQKEEVASTITKVNNTIRPMLILPPPGEESISQELNINEVLNSQNTGYVFDDTAIVKSNNNNNDNITLSTMDTDFDKFMKKRQLIQLFTMLPMPKNDFDIVEEESEEESEEDSIEEESINEEAQEDINISLPSMLHEGLPTPPFKATSSNEYDMVYNEILLRSLRQEDYNLSQQEYVNYGKVEEEIAGLVEGLDETATTPTPTINSNNDNIATLQESISHKLSIIHTLKSDLTYLTPLMAQNQGTSSRLTAQRLPLLTRLQQEYYAKYKLLRDKTANTAKNKRRYRQRAGP